MNATTVSFFVPGHPKTAGSKRAFMRAGMKFPVVVDTCVKGKDWRGDVKRFAIDNYKSEPMIGPLRVTFRFYLPRPKAHFNSKGVLKPNAPTWHPKKPDVLKMARAVEDALTGILWVDDSQIVFEILMKCYSDRIGCEVEVTQVEEVEV